MVRLFSALCTLLLVVLPACFFGTDYSTVETGAASTSAQGGPAFQITLSGPSNLSLGSCAGPYLIEVKDEVGRPAIPLDDPNLAFEVTESTGAQIHLDPNCADAGISNAPANVPLNSDGISGTFYLSGVRATSAILLARLESLLPSQLPLSYVPGPVRGLRWTASSTTMATFTCVETTIEMVDATGTITEQTLATDVQIDSLALSGVTLYTNSNCRSPASQVSFLQGQATKKVWVFASTAGTFGLRASSGSMASPDVEMTAINSNSPKLLISPPVASAISNECKVFTVQSVNAMGQAMPVRLDTLVAVGGGEASVAVYPNETCQDPPSRNLQIAAETDQVKFSAKAEIASNYDLTASTSLFLSGTTRLEVRGGPAQSSLFTLALTEIRANRCSGPYRIQLRDAAGNNTTVGAVALPVGLAGAPGSQTTFYASPDCSTGSVTELPIAAQQGTLVFYLKTARPGPNTITATPMNVSPASQPISVLNTQGYPGSLAWEEISASPFTAGNCVNLKVKSLDANGFPSEVATNPLVLSVGSNSPSTQVFAGRNCASTNAVGVIAVGESQVEVSILETKAGEITLTAVDPLQPLNLSATKTLTLIPNAPAQLLFEGAASPIFAGQCYTAVIALKDAFDNDSKVSAPFPITLDNSGAFQFYSDCATSSAISTVSIPVGSSRVAVSYRARRAGLMQALIALGRTGIAAARELVDVLIQSPTYLRLSRSANVVAGTCTRFQITSVDQAGETALYQDISVALSFGAFTGVFFSDSQCRTSIPSVAMGPTENPVEFYFYSTLATSGPIILTATDSNGGVYTMPVEVFAGSPSAIALSNEGPSTVIAGDWVGPYRVTLRDAFGNTAVTPSQIPLSLLNETQGASIARMVDGSGVAVILANGSSGTFYLSLSEVGEYPLAIRGGSLLSSGRVLNVQNPVARITSLSPANGSPDGGYFVTLTGGPFLEGIRILFGLSECRLQSRSATSLTCSVPSGTGSVNVVAMNPTAALFTLTPGFTYQGPAPVIASVSPTYGSTQGGSSITLSGSNFQAGTLVSLGGSPCNVTSLNANSIVCTTSAHAEGLVNVVVTNSDGGSATRNSAFYYQGSVPSLASVSPGAGPAAGGTVVTLTGAHFRAGVTVSFGGSPCNVSSVAPNSVVCTTSVHENGLVDVTVTNADGTSATQPSFFVYQGEVPTVSSVSPAFGPSTGGTSVVLLGSNFRDGATVSMGGSACNITSLSSGTILCTLSPRSGRTVDVVVTNLDGTKVTRASGFTYQGEAPTISSFSPGFGSSAGGTTFTLLGSHFRPGAAVSLGGSACNITAISSSQIVCTTSAHAMGVVDAVVTNLDGTSATRAAAFVYQDATPTVSLVSPSFGSSQGGTLVTLFGLNFRAGATVALGGSACNVVSLTAVSILCLSSQHEIGLVDVAVENTDETTVTSSLAFNYQGPVPNISSVAPSVGSSSGGTSVTLSGSNFRAGVTVTLGGSPCSITSLSPSTIVCTTSAGGTGLSDAVVTNLDGTTTTRASAFTYQDAVPTLSSISPNYGPLAGGTSLTLDGTNFRAGATVTIGGSPCAITSIALDSIVCTTSSNAGGSASVVVTNTDGTTVTRPNGFIYQGARPTISSISPASGPLTGGTSVTILGSNFRSGTAVSLGGSSCNIDSLNATAIVCTTSAHAVGAVSVVVTNTDETNASLAGAFTYQGASPTLAAVSPNVGPASGGTSVTLSGSNFRAGAVVSFSGSGCNIHSLSATSIVCTTTTHAVGTVEVSVSNSDGTRVSRNAAFTFQGPVPTISTVAPSLGPVGGGTSITLSGTNFRAGATVSLGGSSCNVTSVNPNAIVCTTSSNPGGSVSALVTNSDGTTVTLAGAFVYQGASPSISSLSPAYGGASGGTSLTIGGSNFRAGASVALGGSACNVNSLTATSIVCTTSAHPMGVVDIVVTNSDGSSVTRSGAFTYQGAVPTVSSVSPTVGPMVGGTSITLTGTNFRSGLSVALGGSVCSIVSQSATSIVCTTTAHAEGVVSAVVTNSDGTTVTRASAFTYQNTTTTIASLSPTYGPIAGGTNVSITGTYFRSGATVSFGGSACAVTSLSATSIVCRTSAHAVGLVDVTLTNLDGTTANRAAAFSYQGAAPTVTSILPAFGPAAGGTSVIVNGTNFRTGATVFLGGSPCTVTSLSASAIACTTSEHAIGDVDALVRNSDGTSVTRPAAFTYRGPAPTLSSIAPSLGAATGGTQVTLDGTNFRSGIGISIGGAVCSINSFSVTRIVCTTSAHAAGSVDVVLTNSDGTTVTRSAGFTYQGASPTISSVSPKFGPIAGGTRITLSGTNFRPGATVSLGGSDCSINSAAATSVACTTSAHAVGAVDVLFTNSDGTTVTSSAAFTYQGAAPTIASVSPGFGPIAGGTSVTVVGTNFRTGATLSFGGSACNVTSFGTSRIVCTTTAHASGAVEAIVTNMDGTRGSKSSAFYYQDAAPTISSISPAAGPQAGGTSISIHGANFRPGATVSLGGSGCNISSITANCIVCTASAHAIGAVDVVVSNTDQTTATRVSGFIYQGAAPTITTISPSFGPAGGGTSVTLTGSNFRSGASVSFGGSVCSIVSLSATSILCTTSAHSVGLVNVVITNSDGTAVSRASAFAYRGAIPTLSSVSPGIGPHVGGTSVTLMGTDFRSGASVSFGGSICNVSSLSTTRIICTTTAHAEGAVSVAVTNSDGTSVEKASAFVYQGLAPTIASIYPTYGPIAGGTKVSIKAVNVRPGATASFGGSVCTVSAIRNDSLDCTTTAHAVGPVDIVITNLDGTSVTRSSGFTYQGPSPTITGLAPTSGPLAGGTSVMFSGSNFRPGMTVSLGGSNCNLTSLTPTSFFCVTTSHVGGLVNATVTNSDGTTVTRSSAYTYTSAAPTISGIAPAFGSSSGMTSVGIVGSNFRSGVRVSLGGSPCNLKTLGLTGITCTTTSHAPGVVDVVVTNLDGTSATRVSGYTYVANPVITQISPTSGSTAGGQQVIVTGQNMSLFVRIYLGSAECLQPQVMSPTQLRCVTAPHTPGTGSVAYGILNSTATRTSLTYTYQGSVNSTCAIYAQVSQACGDDHNREWAVAWPRVPSGLTLSNGMSLSTSYLTSPTHNPSGIFNSPGNCDRAPSNVNRTAFPQSFYSGGTTYRLFTDGNLGSIQCAAYYSQYYSPLVIDLYDQGIALSAPNAGVYFDIQGTGTRQAVSWPTNPESSRFLVLPNERGEVENINELFGNNTVGPDGEKAENGFEALAKYDLNGDKIIDEKDAVFNRLMLWSDLDFNGRVDEGELSNLKSSKVRSIDLNYENVSERNDFYGNETKQRSTIDLENGQMRRILDIWFVPG